MYDTTEQLMFTQQQLMFMYYREQLMSSLCSFDQMFTSISQELSEVPFKIFLGSCLDAEFSFFLVAHQWSFSRVADIRLC